MKMKLIQFIGTRNKSDFVLYFAHVLTSLNKRVLIVDNTQNECYRYGYTRLDEGKHLYDFQGIDILCGTTNWLEIEERLQQSDETTVNYDVIISDLDTKKIIEQEWPDFDERFYVSDYERNHQLADVELIRTLFKTTDSKVLKAISFESKYKMDIAYLETVLGEDVEWRSMFYQFEPDERIEELRIRMQHEQEIPFKRLTKQYQELLMEIVSALYGLHIKDVTDSVKPAFFSFRGKPKRVKERKKVELDSVNA